MIIGALLQLGLNEYRVYRFKELTENSIQANKDAQKVREENLKKLEEKSTQAQKARDEFITCMIKRKTPETKCAMK